MKPLHNAAASCLRYSVRSTLCHSQKQQANAANISIATNRFSSSEVSTETDGSRKIVIPRRIERSPTDILKALSSTVKRDYNAPDYKYHDDPFLIPTSNMAKRMFALSQESGRKAARWIRQEHADLFQHKVADPPIQAFFPQAVYDENSEVDENVLLKVIALHQVSDAVTIYNALEKKSVELSRDTKQSLLELLCYYNSQDNLEEEWIEERWFKQTSRSREKKKNVWKKGGIADKLFERMAPHDSASYTAMLCGKAQFGDVDGAYRLYQEALDANIGLPTEAFNKLIVGADILKEGHELRWQFVEEMMAVMKQQGQVPNLGTLNAILETISSMSVNRNSQKNALEVLAEFKTLGIEPSLGSYFFLLRIFCQDRSPIRSAILLNILDLLQDKPQSIKDPRDVLFFLEAMEVSRYHLSDLETAYRVDKLLHAADNYNLIGDSFKENHYYRHFFALICQMGTLKELMDHYDKLVPNVYVPEAGIMEEILKTVELNEAWELLPRLWSDLITFDQSNREPSVRLMLGALRASQTTDAKLKEQLADVAWNIWTRVNGQHEDRVNKISWTGEMLGDILRMLLRADKYSQSLEIMMFLEKKQQEILGVPAIDSMAAFLDKSIERNETKNAIWCVQYCSDAGYEDTVRLAQKLNESEKLSQADRDQLVNIVGSVALQKQAAAAS